MAYWLINFTQVFSFSMSLSPGFGSFSSSLTEQGMKVAVSVESSKVKVIKSTIDSLKPAHWQCCFLSYSVVLKLDIYTVASIS